MNEYVIINAEAIQKRIEELEKEIKFLQAKDAYGDIGRLSAFKQILSQSTPLIQEIEKIIILSSLSDIDHIPDRVEKVKEDYISNLKLDI